MKIFVPHDAYLVSDISCTLGEVTMPYGNVEDKGYNKITLKGDVTLGEIKIVRM